MFDPEKFGEAMGVAIKAATAPLLERIKELQAQIDKVDARLEPVILEGKAGADGERGTQGEKGADGLGMAGAMIDRDGNLQITMTNGEVKNLGQVVGQNGTNGKDGSDGVSFENFEMEYLQESHEISVKASVAGRVKEIRYDAGGLRPRGYWCEGGKAKANEAWTEGGALWIAVKDTTSKPGLKNDAWILAARAGRDGDRGRDAKFVDNAPIKLGV